MSTPLGALRRFFAISAIAAAFSATAGAQGAATTPPPAAANQTGKAPAPSAAQADARKKMEESIARQKESVRKQSGAPAGDGFFTTAWIGPPPAIPAPDAPACERLEETQAAPWIAKSATETKVDPVLLREVIRRESAFVPCAVSAKGAMGMMQLMPDTVSRFHVADPFNAGENIAAGARYLKELLDRFHGNLEAALAGYNAGPQTVDNANGGVPDIAETRDYVKAIVDAVRAAAKPDK